jgi:hypothetical protein
MIAILDPWQANPGWWARAMPPFWQYFSVSNRLLLSVWGVEP